MTSKSSDIKKRQKEQIKKLLVSNPDIPLSTEAYDLLEQVGILLLKDGVTDIHVTETKPLWFRLKGDMYRSIMTVPENLIPSLTRLLFRRSLERANVGCSFFGRRIRLRQSKTLGRKQLFIRNLPPRAPRLEDLGYGNILDPLRDALPSGLFLVAGATGSGKSTLLASLIQRYADSKSVHIMTVEDPVEYVIEENANCEVTQREIPDDADDFATAIRNMLREDPDVLMIGEIRDRESAAAALTAAETGHTVFATVHASGLGGIVDRLIGMLSDLPDCTLRFADAFFGGIMLRVIEPTKYGESRRRQVDTIWTCDEVKNIIRDKKFHDIEKLKESFELKF